MRCDDCIDGEIDPSECCDARVAEQVGYLEGYAEALAAAIDASERSVAALRAGERTALHRAINDLIAADYDREACGGVIEGLIDDWGTADHRRLHRQRPW